MLEDRRSEGRRTDRSRDRSGIGAGFDIHGGLDAEPVRATVRGRVGYAFGPILVYATGGWGVSRVGFSGSVAVPGVDLPRQAANRPDAIERAFPFGGYASSYRTSVPVDGYGVGGGIAYAIDPSWSVTSASLYADLSRSAPVAVDGVQQKVDIGGDVHRIRCGLEPSAERGSERFSTKRLPVRRNKAPRNKDRET